MSIRMGMLVVLVAPLLAGALVEMVEMEPKLLLHPRLSVIFLMLVTQAMVGTTVA